MVERTGMLYISGDSLTRQVAQALLGVLSGDYRTGSALQLEGNDRDRCACDLQFALRHGHLALTAAPTSRQRHLGPVAHQRLHSS